MDPKILEVAVIQLSNLQWNLSRPVGVHRAMFQEAEKERGVSGKDLENFFNSEPCVRAQKLLQARKDVAEVTLGEVVTCRNYLISKMIINNMLRPCALERVETKAFLNLEKDPDTEMYVVPLYYDKTVGACGRAVYVHMTGKHPFMIHIT